MEHHTKNKGDLGVLKVKVDLVSKGFLVGSLDTEHSPFDIIAYKDKTFKRVQVKYRSLKNGKLEVQFSSSWADKNGSHVKPIDKNEVDLYAIYCSETETCYYLNPSNFGKSVSLRVENPGNNQSKLIKFANDYLQVP